jgi:glutathionylspermidine synthase
MRVVKKAISFDMDKVLEEETPFIYTYYRGTVPVQELLEFPMLNKAAMPFYTVKESTTYKLNGQFEAYYQMMLAALKIAFNNPELLNKYFDCEFLRKHGKRFIPYAKYTFSQNQPAIYGRYDACFDPENEELVGIYEFNGDTPVMLFESVNLQDRFSFELGTDQYNNWWDISMERFKHGYRNVAVVCSTDYVDDMATSDTISQMFSYSRPERNVSLLDMKELDFDHANISKPFVAKDSEWPLDAVYILSPWEEMVENFPTMLDNWDRWADNVHIFEPAWRWFLAHKGMTALCTFLCNDTEFRHKHYQAYKVLIPTYLSKPFREKCVEKPVVGRLSNNIRIWNANGQLLSDTGGFYSQDNSVFQLYCAPRKVEGRNNFILGMWMSGSHSASMCAREFDTEVLSVANERFVPHIVVEG